MSIIFFLMSIFRYICENNVFFAIRILIVIVGTMFLEHFMI